MKLNCKECGNLILAADINISNLIAKCSNCNSVFSFEDKSTIKKNENLKIDRGMVPLPKGIKVKEIGGNLEIEMKWFRWSNVFLTFFTLFWDGFMIVWFTISITSGAWPMAIFGLLHGGVGVYLTYQVLAGYVNSTHITISRSLLNVKIGPLPWPGNISIPAHDIVQLYSKRVITRGKNITESFEVHGILNNGTHISIVRSLDQTEQAFYIEQKIEEFLRIEDTPVRGEIER